MYPYACADATAMYATHRATRRAAEALAAPLGPPSSALPAQEEERRTIRSAMANTAARV